MSDHLPFLGINAQLKLSLGINIPVNFCTGMLIWVELITSF